MLLCYVLILWLRGVWDLSSPTRDRNCISCIGSLNHRILMLKFNFYPKHFIPYLPFPEAQFLPQALHPIPSFSRGSDIHIPVHITATHQPMCHPCQQIWCLQKAQRHKGELAGSEPQGAGAAGPGAHSSAIPVISPWAASLHTAPSAFLCKGKGQKKKNASVQKASHTHTSINTACSGSGCLPRPTPVHWNSCPGLLLPLRGVLNLKQSVCRMLWAEPGRGAHSCLSCHAAVTSQVLLCHQGLPTSTGAVILSLRVPDSHRWCYVPNGHQ